MTTPEQQARDMLERMGSSAAADMATKTTVPERALHNALSRGVVVTLEPTALEYFRNDTMHGCDKAARGLLEKGAAGTVLRAGWLHVVLLADGREEFL